MEFNYLKTTEPQRGDSLLLLCIYIKIANVFLLPKYEEERKIE